jgi:hypothetical protein
MSYLLYEKAKASAAYIALVATAVNSLTTKGSFSRVEVMAANPQYAVFEDAVNWKYVVRMIEEQEKVTLIPLAASYFKRHARIDEKSFPERFAAVGYGKKTAGYALATLQYGHFVVYLLEHKRKRADGVAKAVNKSYAAAAGAGIAVTGQPYKLPVQQQTPPTALPAPTPAIKSTP